MNVSTYYCHSEEITTALWETEILWDNLLPEEPQDQWLERFKDVQELQKVTLLRCYDDGKEGNAICIELHTL